MSAKIRPQAELPMIYPNYRFGITGLDAVGCSIFTVTIEKENNWVSLPLRSRSAVNDSRKRFGQRVRINNRFQRLILAMESF